MFNVFFNILLILLCFTFSVKRSIVNFAYSFCFSPMNRNSVLAELRVKRLAVIQEVMCKSIVGGQETA